MLCCIVVNMWKTLTAFCDICHVVKQTKHNENTKSLCFLTVSLPCPRPNPSSAPAPPPTHNPQPPTPNPAHQIKSFYFLNEVIIKFQPLLKCHRLMHETFSSVSMKSANMTEMSFYIQPFHWNVTKQKPDKQVRMTYEELGVAGGQVGRSAFRVEERQNCFKYKGLIRIYCLPWNVINVEHE